MKRNLHDKINLRPGLHRAILVTWILKEHLVSDDSKIEISIRVNKMVLGI